MQAIDAPSWVFLLACAGLCYTGFCRLVHVTPSTTDARISFALWLFTVSATFGVFSVMLLGYRTGWPESFLTFAMLVLHVTTSKAWLQGLPPGYRKPVLDESQIKQG